MMRLPNCYGAATGSSKPPRRSTGEKPHNEDRWTAQSLGDAGLYGVFDGHGGGGAAEFVANHLPGIIQTKLQDLAKSSMDEGRPFHCNTEHVRSALTEAFLDVDNALYQHVRSQPVPTRPVRMYRENPCICTGVALPANVGSTGSVVYVTSSHIACGSIGDSEVLLISEVADQQQGLPGHTTEANSPGLPREPTAKRLRVDSSTVPSNHSSPSQHHCRSLPVSFEARLTAQMLTEIDTPTTNETCKDFQRIKQIAMARTRTRSGQARERYRHGIMCHSHNHRLNYVALSGAHRLNMTRAFGNFGHKEWKNRGRTALESASPVIARPHVHIHERTGRERFLVIGSDGLWDNLDKSEVTDVLRQEFHAGPSVAADGAAASLAAASADSESRSSQWQAVAQRAAAALITRALTVRKKPDDITCVVVMFT